MPLETTVTPTSSALDFIGSPEWYKRGREQLREAIATGDLRRAFVIAGMLNLGRDCISTRRRRGGRVIASTVSARSIAKRLGTVKVAALRLVARWSLRGGRPGRRPVRRSGSRARSPGRKADPPEPPPSL